MVTRPKKLQGVAETKLLSCLDKAREALKSKDIELAIESFHEIEGIVKAVDNFDMVPHTPGSLASTWYNAHWFHGNYPKGNEYLITLRSVLTAIEIWLSQEPQRFEEPPTERISSFERCPFFRRSLPLDPSLVFMLMPFTESWSNRIWNRHLKPAIERVPVDPPLIAKRADDLFGPDVMTDIFESIMRAAVIIADITNRNANVFYELGLSHALGKRVLILAQGAQHIPFDLLRFRHLLYEDNSESCEKLEDSIVRALADILRDTNHNA